MEDAWKDSIVMVVSHSTPPPWRPSVAAPTGASRSIVRSIPQMWRVRIIVGGLHSTVFNESSACIGIHHDATYGGGVTPLDPM